MFLQLFLSFILCHLIGLFTELVSRAYLLTSCLICRRMRRFLVIDEAQFILVEPDTSKLGWGVVKFVARLQVCFYLGNVPKEAG